MSTKKKRTFSQEFKQDAVSLIGKEGYTLKEASERLGINASLLSKWKRDIADKISGEVANHSNLDESLLAENRQLKIENRRLQMERDILKKATAFFAKESL